MITMSHQNMCEKLFLSDTGLHYLVPLGTVMSQRKKLTMGHLTEPFILPFNFPTCMVYINVIGHVFVLNCMTYLS